MAPVPSRAHATVVDELFRRLSGDADRAVLLTGLPGIGKSTTVGLLAARFARAGTSVHRVEADDMSRSRPFGLIAGLLGVEAVYPPGPDTVDRMVGAAERLCAEGPVLLCADDLHQADGDSLDLLGWLVDMSRYLPLSLLLTRRPLPVREGLAVLAARPDVHEVELSGLAPEELDTLVTARYGAPPGLQVQELLAVTGGNPFHARVMLDDLQRRGLLDAGRELLTTSATAADTPASVQAGARTHLAMLDPASRDLLQVLAVWGRPAAPDQLAAVTGSRPAALLGAIQAAVGSGVARWTDDGLLAFRHDLYRDVVYADLEPPLRKMLHAACAAELRTGGEIPSQVLQQSAAAALSATSEAEVALQVAETDLAHAPAQAADLLATAAEQVAALPAGPERTQLEDRIALARTGVLATAGRMAEAMHVASEALDRTSDPAVRAGLVRLRLHHIVSTADVPGALSEIDRHLAGELPDSAREALTQLRRWVVVLGGREPVGDGVPTGSSGAALLPAAVNLFLSGRCRRALHMIDDAVRARVDAGSPDWADGPTAPVLPPWFALYADGIEVARARSMELRRQAQQSGRGWQLPYHLFVAASIEYVAGRWDDALAFLDSGLEATAVTGTGWLSRAVGLGLGMRVRRGELDTAATGLSRWKLRALPEQYGLPAVGHAEMLLHEACGDLAGAIALARRSWIETLGSGRLVWAVYAGPDTARIALQVGDTDLLARVTADSAAAPVQEMPGMAPATDLIRAIAERDPDRAMAAASAFAGRGHVPGELGAWEEAAVAAAARGDTERARSCAARCTNMADLLGATTVERRLTARLREHEIRLGVTGRRRRPSSGWNSLTPTELQVAKLVGRGLTSPQIAARLYVSPRTVQTHISHSLRKLGLGSRVELATTVARHR
ncbi:LuxR C-terminal-related transcriptional regulator [Geodermatophilus poikilotrophus]|uniref:AAA ATPase domain-containing protein n=1 Tax=Geodermatophilus poikilotrophus TaxID=1333667 RepID=A0A1H9YF48_9ACTN|nr:LuxR C-terminal-related transcriptional regulator [Geodermatophilus poikilotrophus]SES67518.1 AAA ATPase domain-containing protein [Geodermatophilus poikilotrophus]